MNPATTTDLRAGVARRDLTAAGVPVNDPLFAKALVLDNGQTRAAIVVIDAVAIGGIGDINDEFLPAVRARIESELGLPGTHVLVSATHTHPPGRILCDDAEQIERTFAAVHEAQQQLTPVRVGVGVGHEDRFVINRTLRLTNGKHWTIRHANPCPPDDEVAGLGPMDPRIGVVRLDRPDGTPLAALFNYACHPLQGIPSGPVTANYPGFACQVIEANLGHGALALFVQGAGGDQCEVLYKDTGQPRHAEPLGTMLGLSTLRALREVTPCADVLRVVNEPLALPRRTDIVERVAALEAEQAELLASLRSTSLNFKRFLPLYLQHGLNPQFPGDYAYRYLHAEHIGSADLTNMDAENRRNLDKYLRNIQAMERMARNQDKIATLHRHAEINRAAGEPTVATEVQGLRIGDCVLVSSPTEVLMQVALNIKAASPHQHTWVAAFSNGYIHYGPPAADYDAGGYEVTECFLAPEWQALYEAKAQEVLARL